jgi:uncharacterized protein YfdQ (DUF2303 family)
MEEETHDPNETRAAVNAGRDAVTLEPRMTMLEVEGITVPIALTDTDQGVNVLSNVIQEVERRLPGPRRRKGTATHSELDSFVDHVNRFKGGPTTVWADIRNVKLMAIFDYHPQAGAAWCEHRSIYACPLSQQWQAWRHISGELLSVADFGAFIEAHRDDITSGKDKEEKPYPSPASVEEMAMNLHIQTKGTFTRRIDKRTGDFELTCKQETDDSVSTEIPRAFLLGLPVFEGGELYAVEARVRVHLRDGNAKLGIELHRADEVLRDAFGAVRKAVAERCEVPVFAGSAES